MKAEDGSWAGLGLWDPPFLWRPAPFGHFPVAAAFCGVSCLMRGMGSVNPEGGFTRCPSNCKKEKVSDVSCHFVGSLSPSLLNLPVRRPHFYNTEEETSSGRSRTAGKMLQNAD